MAQRLQHVVTNARHDGQSAYVLIALDLDGFTAISASYGQKAAAQLLEAVGARLASCLRPTDTIARYGCDEFCMLVPCTSDRPLEVNIYEHVQYQLAAPFILEGHHIAVTACVGIARVHARHETGNDVRRDAYAAVHEAKLRGGNQCALFDDSMHEKTRARLQLEAELHHAIERREFRLHYQPIVSTATGRLVSLEALIRWHHPQRGCLPPSEFLVALAATGLMAEIGSYIVEEACRQSAIWRLDPSFDASISLNVSPRQLLERGFIDDVMRILDANGAEPSWIELEITEDIALGDGEAALEALRVIRDRGIQVRIDDFGTGYSSLSYLQRLPVQGLKIDRAFLEQMEHDSRRREIVGAIIRLAHVLGLDVVAEGVERQEQLEELRTLECDFVQGYFVSKPLAAHEVTVWLELERRS
jgi:diguanylate cyclase (GGDEF)-like protein